MKSENFFDIHSHVIFDVDDGAKKIEESLELLRLLKESGAIAVAATPHFWGDVMNLSEQLSKVKTNFEVLQNATKGDSPDLLLGFEVRYFRDFSKAEAIKELTYGNSKYMLVEMRYNDPITDRCIEEIKELTYSFGITPILAHIERFAKYPGYKGILSLIEQGFVKAQVNADSFEDRSRKKEALRLIKGGYIDFLASDTHSVDSRPPKTDMAFRAVETALGKETVNKLQENSLKFYNEIK